MRLSDEARAIENRWAGWHIYFSDMGHPWAVKVHPADHTGCGVTLECHGMARAEQVIAEWEHAHAFAYGMDIVAPLGIVA